MMVECCTDCDKRGCGAYHDICPQYQAELKKIKQIKKKEYAYNELNSYEYNRRAKKGGR